MIKRRKNKSHVIIIGSLLVLLGITLPLSKYVYNNYLDKMEKEKVEDFFNEPIIEEEIIEVQENSSNIEQKPISYNYIAVLEIPTISLKRGLVSKNDKANNVNKNIQILQESDMPDVENGAFMLAGHSGTSRISFFNKLHHVKYGDEVIVYYNNIKYIYRVIDLFIEVKDGDISIQRDKDKNTIVLTTCSQDHKGSQFVVIGELIDKQSY